MRNFLICLFVLATVSVSKHESLGLSHESPCQVLAFDKRWDGHIVSLLLIMPFILSDTSFEFPQCSLGQCRSQADFILEAFITLMLFCAKPSWGKRRKPKHLIPYISTPGVILKTPITSVTVGSKESHCLAPGQSLVVPREALAHCRQSLVTSPWTPLRLQSPHLHQPCSSGYCKEPTIALWQICWDLSWAASWWLEPLRWRPHWHSRFLNTKIRLLRPPPPLLWPSLLPLLLGFSEVCCTLTFFFFF